MTVLHTWAARAGLGSLALASLVWFADLASAGDVKAGRALTQKCEACHGVDGVSKIVEAPNLAGQTEPYLIKALTLYKEGQRQNDMMSVVAPTLTETEIADLAAYYSAIPVTIGKLPGE
jgi:cytochrome c553